MLLIFPTNNYNNQTNVPHSRQRRKERLAQVSGKTEMKLAKFFEHVGTLSRVSRYNFHRKHFIEMKRIRFRVRVSERASNSPSNSRVSGEGKNSIHDINMDTCARIRTIKFSTRTYNTSKLNFEPVFFFFRFVRAKFRIMHNQITYSICEQWRRTDGKSVA